MSKARKKPAKASPAKISWLESPRFKWIVFAIYFVILLLIFSNFVFSDMMLYGSDTIQAQIYMKNFNREYFDPPSHLVPEWSPYIFGGMPFVDAMNSDLFYLPTWPFKFTPFIPLYRGLGWSLIFHFLLGGIGMYFAARGWNLSRLAAAVAGLAYMTATYFISMVHPGHDGKIMVTAWFPLGFLFLKRIWDHARLRDMAIFALIVGLIILTPHVQMAYFSLWAYAAFSVYRIVRAIREEKRLPWRPSFGALGAVLVAVGISAVQFYPAYFYVKNFSPRAGEGRGFEYASSWSLHPEEIVNEVVPNFSGVADTDGNTYWGRNYFKDNSEYGGLVALLLAVFAVFQTRFRDRWFFFGLGIFAALYGLGAHTPLFKLFYYVVPNVKQMRAPSMIMFLYLFSIVLCAAAAIDALWTYRREKGATGSPTKLLWIIAAVLGGLALLFTIAPAGMMSIYTNMFYSDIEPQKAQILATHQGTIVLGFWLAAIIASGVAYFASTTAHKKALWAIGGIAVLILFDNIRMDHRFIQTADLSRYLPHNPVVDFLHQQPQPIRVVAAPRGFPTNYFAYYGIPEMTGYHGNQLRTYNTFLGGSQQQRAFTRPAMAMDAVQYIVFRRGVNLSGELNDPTLRKVYDQGGTVVYQNLLAVQHARLVTCWELHDPADSTYQRLYDTTFDYQNCVIVDSALPFASHMDSTSAGTATITTYEDETVEVSVDATTDALLVLADNNYPAWQASVDGSPAPIITTNATFRGVVVPPGKHTVRFEYHSSRLRVGVWVSLLSVLIVGLVFGMDTWNSRRRNA